MNILDWFDVENVDHLRAYNYLNNTGTWPGNFLPDNVELPNLWQVTLAGRLANAYLDLKLGSGRNG